MWTESEMKKIIIITLLLTLTAFTVNAQFLFRISGNGLEQPSYMLGTIHTLHGSVLDYTPEYTDAESQCRQFFTEYDVTDRQRMKELHNAIEQTKGSLTLPDGKSILDLLSKEQIELLDVRVKEVFGHKSSDQRMSFLWNFQPIVFTNLINNKIMAEANRKHGPRSNSRSALIDETCIVRAKLHGKEIGELDELEDRLKLQGFWPQSIEEQLDSLMDLVANYDQRMELAVKEIEALKQSTVYWCLADFQSFSVMDMWQTKIRSFPLMFKVRNEKWLPKMQSAMKKTPTMFVFGAGHLLGDEGIIHLLRNAGYKVEQVKSKK